MFKKVLLLAAALLLAFRYFTASPPLPPPPLGYCATQKRIIPEKEFIKKAILHKGYREAAKFDGRHYSLINCCVVFRHQGEFYRTSNGYAKEERLYEIVMVYFNYELNEQAREFPYLKNHLHKNQKYMNSLHLYDACGTPINIGEGLMLPGAPFNELNGKPKINERALKYFISWPNDGNQIN